MNSRNDKKKIYMNQIIAIHEHELKPNVNPKQYEQEVDYALTTLNIPGLLKAYHLKGFKGKRNGRYAVVWIFENKDAITKNFGTPENPKWPKDWLHYENEILAKFLDRHPDSIDFTDYEIISILPSLN